MIKNFIKGFLKFVLITMLVGIIIWLASSLYRFIRNRFRGH